MSRRYAPPTEPTTDQRLDDVDTSLQDRISPSGYYYITTNVLPTDYEDMLLYAGQDEYRMPELFFYDTSEVVISFVPNVQRMLEDGAYAQVVLMDIEDVLSEYNLPDGTIARVSLFLTHEAANGSRNYLGGSATLSLQYDVHRDVFPLGLFMTHIEDHNYLGFDLLDVEFHVSIPIIPFVRGVIRGGALMNEHLCEQFKNLPLFRDNRCLLLVKYMTPAQKGCMRKHHRLCGPTHLSEVKGLLFYSWKREWYPYCGLMAVYYSFQVTIGRKIFYDIERVSNLTNLEGQDRTNFILETFDRDHGCFKNYVNKISNGEGLYAETIKMIEEQRFDGLASFPSLISLGKMCTSVYPGYTLVVYDKSRHILYRTQSAYARSILCDPPEKPYKKGELTSEEIEKYERQRICIFYDHVTEHFLPIFDVGLFMQRRTLDVSFRVVGQSLENSHQTDANGDVVRPEAPSEATFSKVRDKRITSCPFCDMAIYVGYEASHFCYGLRCRLCEELFYTQDLYNQHCNPNMKQPKYRCRNCRQICFSSSCLKKHQRCCNMVVYVQCTICNGMVNSKQRVFHKCRQYKCTNCEKQVANTVNYNHPDYPNGYVQYHRCFMHPPKSSEEQDSSSAQKIVKRLRSSEGTSAVAVIEEDREPKELYFVFDFESALLRDTQFGRVVIDVHRVNCISSAPVVLEYDESTTETFVRTHTKTQYNLYDFWKYLISVSTSRMNVWVAHNFKGYDGRLFYDFLTFDLGIVPTSITRIGDKIMEMQIVHPTNPDRLICFRDSLNHIARSLAALPEMFGLDPSIIKKGFFPYKFNIPENELYVGLIPDKAYFEPEKLSRREEFEAWYEEYRESHREYDFKQEMTDYCENDVLVLSLSLSKYVDIFLRYSFGMNPLKFMTIAQFTYRLYQTYFMPDNTLCYLDDSFDSFARRALHGGNTNVRRLYYKCTPEEAGTFEDGEKGLRYIDIQSLYPTVQYYDPMPVGYPRTSFFSPINQPSDYFLRSFMGFIECDIAPINFQFHPLIPRFSGHKLFMDLHPHEKVVLTSVEFQLACYGLDKGVQFCNPMYRCSMVYRVDVYDTTCDLFKRFVRNWLKLKIISGKRPKDEYFPQFARELSQRLGIEVTKEDFDYNESLRTNAKLVLNSLWGKFGQRTRMPRTEIYQTANELYYYNEQIRLNNITEKAHEPVGNIAFAHTFIKNNEWNKKNTPVAAFVTACARIRLWKVLFKLGERVLYHDTDSVIYERRSRDDVMIEEGNFLGDWESETGGQMIHEFVGLAPKTYAYRFYDKNGELVEKVKSKGFSNNAMTKSVLTLDSYVALLRKDVPAIELATTFFRHSREAGVTFTYDDVKKLKFNYQKGFVDENGVTFPYGSQRFIRDNPSFNDESDQCLLNIRSACDSGSEEQSETDDMWLDALLGMME